MPIAKDSLDSILAHAPFNYRLINTDMIQGYSDEKLLKHVASQDWVNSKGGYAYVAELCKRLEQARANSER